jgi:HSP20 family protein
MVETAIRLPVKNESKSVAPTAGFVWHPFGSLRREIDHLFDDFDTGFWNTPFRRSVFDVAPFRRTASWTGTPAVDVVEKDGEYEITSELPGMEEKDIDIKLTNGMLMIKGEKKETKDEKRKDYFLSERCYGSFERSFAVPEGVDLDKIAATFKSGVLTLTLPKTAVALKQEKKITVKAA